MSRRISALITHGDCDVGDAIVLTFKSNKVRAKLAESGIIHRTCLLAESGSEKDVLVGRTFQTLSDWADACLQEILQEYSTRYPAWKRVKHCKTNMTFEDMWKLYKERGIEQVLVPSKAELTQLVDRLHERVARQQEVIERLKEGKTHASEDEEIPRARIMMNSPWATHIVLQRVAQTKPERLGEIREIGIDGMKAKLKKFVNTQRVLEVPEEEVGWFKDIVEEGGKDAQKIAQRVFDFFQRI